MSSGSEKKDLKVAHRTVFDELLDNSSLPAAEKALPWLVEEAQIVVSAGSTTTLYYLKCTTYFILTDQAIHSAYVELLAAIPDPGTLTALPVLESLAFLAAVTKEGFWNNDAASSRLARVSSDDDLECGERIIRKGISISRSTCSQHRDPKLLTKGNTFEAARWLEPGAAKLEQYLVSFPKGTRQCLDINLAKSEIYLKLAAVFRRFELEFFKT
ncbi:hypothetical protein LTR49_028244 [Elasticomyces elasticus]|nr:hypothetical protein LTR49_028244 [Elasticomyces elasticus]